MTQKLDRSYLCMTYGQGNLCFSPQELCFLKSEGGKSGAELRRPWNNVLVGHLFPQAPFLLTTHVSRITWGTNIGCWEFTYLESDRFIYNKVHRTSSRSRIPGGPSPHRGNTNADMESCRISSQDHCLTPRVLHFDTHIVQRSCLGRRVKVLGAG